MKILSKIISIVLVLATLLMVGCSTENTNNNSNNNVVVEESNEQNHYSKMTERNDYIIENNKSDYIIVKPADSTEYENMAVTLLQTYFYNSFGVKLSVKDDSTISSFGKYISIGDTILMRSSGLSISESEFGSSGFRIATVGDTIIISGSRNGLRVSNYYGVQKFLELTINYKAYAKTEIRYDIKNSLKMYDFDVVEIPDFDNRRVGYAETMYDLDYVLLLNLSPKDETSLNQLSGHSDFEILEPSVYASEHPDWYYHPNGKTYEEVGESFRYQAQLCMTNEELLAEFIKNLTQMFIENPTATFAHLGMQDVKCACGCENCVKWMNDHNTNEAGLNNHFINLVARGVSENIKKISPNRKLTFETFAYYATMEPPVHKDESGNYVADDTEVIPDDNVYIQFTPLLSNGYQAMDHQSNTQYREYLDGWASITDNLSVWKYCINFHFFPISLKNWDTVKADYVYYKSKGVNRMYEQAAHYSETLQMYEMRAYVMSKLMWNINLNYDELVEEFINAFYEPYSDVVLSYYKMMSSYQEKLRSVEHVDGIITQVAIETPTYWTFGYVESVRKTLTSAYDKIASLKFTNPTEYEKHYWRISNIYYENIYMQLEYYMDKYSKEYVTEQIELFESIVNKNGITVYAEGTAPISSIIQAWEGKNNVS